MRTINLVATLLVVQMDKHSRYLSSSSARTGSSTIVELKCKVLQVMYIVLDANIIISEGYGNSVHFGLLMSWSSAMGHEVYVPKIVIEEVVAHFSRSLDSATKRAADSLSKLSRLLPVPLQSPLERLNVKELTNQFRTRLFEKFDTPDTAILDYPDVSHEYLVKRARRQEGSPLIKVDTAIEMP